MKLIRALLFLTLVLPLAATAAPLCVAGTMNKGSVRIEIDSATGKATPDTCEVQAGTVVHWKGGKAFETYFHDSPATSGDKNFVSHRVLFHHETTPFTAKDVKQPQEKFPYDTHTEKASDDPTIIVDPK